MFEPQPTPFNPFVTSYGVNRHLPPDYSFQQTTPLHGGGSPSLLYGQHSPSSTSSSAAAAFTPTSCSLPLGALPRELKMEPDSQALQDEIAAQEAAAREYQPNLEGPLVGERVSSDVIAEEYAKADPVYVEKTMALPRTYSQFRQIQGDGNCGWRAVGFGYFETMIQTFSKQQFADELVRLTGLNQLIINAGGFDFSLFEDMVDETIQLLNDVAAHCDNRQMAHAVLMERFNNREISHAIIYHLRLLAASALKADPHLYLEFIPERNVETFSNEWLQRPDREIEHVGLTLLTSVLLKPLRFFVDVVYLDRSPGSQVNVYHFPDGTPPDDTQEGSSPPVISLLYRPDHYDILYKPPPPQQQPPPPPPPLSIQVHRAAFTPDNHGISSTPASFGQTYGVDFSPLALIEGFMPSSMSPLSTEPLSADTFATPQSPWMPQVFADPLTGALSPARPTQAPQPPPPPPPPTQMPAAPISAPPAAAVAGLHQTQYPLRFSREMHRLGAESFHEPAFTTTMFKNSHFNKAHYNNPDFHPEEWTPNEDEMPERPEPRARRRGRHRASGD